MNTPITFKTSPFFQFVTDWDHYQFGDIVKCFPSEHFMILQIKYTSSQYEYLCWNIPPNCSRVKIRIYRSWFWFKHKWLPRFLDFHLAEFQWYRQLVKGNWILVTPTDEIFGHIYWWKRGNVAGKNERFHQSEYYE